MPSAQVPNFEEMMRQADKKPAQAAAGGQEKPDGAEGDSTSRFTAIVVLVAILACLFSVHSHWEPDRWLHNDAAFYMNTIRSVMEHGTLRQEAMHPHSWYDTDLGWNRNVDAAWSNIALGRNGEWWPKHPILMPLCAIPFVWAFGSMGTLVFQCLCVVLIALFTWRIARRFAPRPAALAATLVLVTSGWMSNVIWGFSNDAFLSALVLGAVDAALSLKAVPSGVLMGLAIFAKPTCVLFAPGVLGVFLFRKDWRAALKFCAAAAVPCAIFAASNAYLYGAPWKTGYDNILVRIDGKLSTRSHRDDFAFSLAGLKAGLANVAVGRTYGFSRNFPFFLLGLLGIVPLMRRQGKRGLLLTWMILVPVAFHAPFHWYRIDFSLPSAALAMAPFAVLLSPGGAPYQEKFQGSQVNWARLAPFLAALVLLAGGGIYRLARTPGDTLWQATPTAKVTHGKRPCDYYNNNLQRWECSGIRGDGEMTGRALSGLKFSGKQERMLLVAPASDGSAKTMTFPGLKLGRKLSFRAGLADGAAKGVAATVQVSIGGSPVATRKFSKVGKLETFQVDTSHWNGKAKDLTLKVTSDGKRFKSGDAPLGIGAQVEE